MYFGHKTQRETVRGIKKDGFNKIKLGTVWNVDRTHGIPIS